MRGDTEEISDTPAGPAARSCPSKVPERPAWGWGSQEKGRGYRQCPHQAQGCVGRQLARARGPVHRGHGAESQASPPGSGEGSWHHLPACQRRWGPLGRGRSTPPARPEKRRAFVSGKGGGGARMEYPLQTDSWEAGRALEMEKAGFKSRICLL